MFNQPLREVMGKNRLLIVSAATTVLEAAQMMAEAATGAVVIVADQVLQGIFTERDIAFRVVARRLDPASTTVGSVMTSAPKVLAPDMPFGAALALMHKHGFRHIPVVEDGRPIGIVFARNALDPEMEEFIAEARRRDRYSAATQTL